MLEKKEVCFEILERDLLARIGRLETKSGKIETPILLPVINPNVQPITPRDMKDRFQIEALITNAYILKKKFGEKVAEKGIHKFLDFDKTVMTDSGAYQILVYGEVETEPKQIVEYQEEIDTDIAVILDVPTGWGVSRERAEKTVEETFSRAKELERIKKRDDILWVGPVQGGEFIDLIAKSAASMSNLPFHIYALGSPTPVMEQYLFDKLVDMIMAAKMNLPLNKPFHLFGAGHPFMFALIVALGCDMFDSAAYAIFARENRYMTERGTVKVDKLKYFPCSCPVCAKRSPKEVLEMPKIERERFLAEHNLYVCLAEIRRIKQAIREGRLWEHLILRAHSHPALLRAVKKLRDYSRFIEKFTPITKKSGLLFFSGIDLARPEVLRHEKRLLDNYSVENVRILVLLPQTEEKPYGKSKQRKVFFKHAKNLLGSKFFEIHLCTYAAPFGVIPSEIEETYPLSQNEVVVPLGEEMINYVADQVRRYIISRNYDKVVLLNLSEWKGRVKESCLEACRRKNISFLVFDAERWDSKTAREFAVFVAKSV